MAKEKKYMLIEEETLREMLQTRFQQTYALVLLSHICLKHNLDTSLTMAEISGVLQLSGRQVDDARKRCQLRFLGIGGGRLYSAYDIAMLAARLHRKRAMTPQSTTGKTNDGSDEHWSGYVAGLNRPKIGTRPFPLKILRHESYPPCVGRFVP